jgi:hypothetical protein
VKKTKQPNSQTGPSILQRVLSASQPRPPVESDTSEKIQYAVRFADQMASHLAADLSPRLKGIQATTKRSAGAVSSKKQLDINFSTVGHGLVVGISLKSVHLRDYSKKKKKIGRYTHNMKRNEEELRIEASGYHKRQPYAVMIGVLFLPFESCDDAKVGASSFGSWVRHLRPYCGRNGPDDEIDRFEKLYVALYEPEGSDLRFFDVEGDPPKYGRPATEGTLLDGKGRIRRMLTYAEFLDAIYQAYEKRNPVGFRWADGSEAPLELDETEPQDFEDETEDEDET